MSSAFCSKKKSSSARCSKGEKAEGAHKKVSKSAGKMLRIRKDGDDAAPAPATHTEVPKRLEEV